MADDSALVDYQHGTTPDATVGVPEVVSLGHLAMGVPIGKLWKRDAA